jgi:Flp pilus assembly protein TadG
MKQRERGVAIIEAALVLPVFFLLVLGIFEFGIMLSAYHSMEGAAREGARVAVVPNPSTGYTLPSNSTVASAVCAKLQAGVFRASNVTACNGGAVNTAAPCPANGVPPSTLTAENVYVSTCTVAVPEGGTENYIQVAVHRNLQLFWGWQFPLTARAVMRSEAN